MWRYDFTQGHGANERGVGLCIHFCLILKSGLFKLRPGAFLRGYFFPHSKSCPLAPETYHTCLGGGGGTISPKGSKPRPAVHPLRSLWFQSQVKGLPSAELPT